MPNPTTAARDRVKEEIAWLEKELSRKQLQLKRLQNPTEHLLTGVYAAVQILPLEQQVRFLTAFGKDTGDTFEEFLNEHPLFETWYADHREALTTEPSLTKARETALQDYDLWRATQPV